MGITDWETPPQPQPQPEAAGKELRAESWDATVGGCLALLQQGGCSEPVPVGLGCLWAPGVLGASAPPSCAWGKRTDAPPEAPALAGREHSVQQALLSPLQVSQALGTRGWGQPQLHVSPAFRGASAPALTDNANTACRSGSFCSAVLVAM